MPFDLDQIGGHCYAMRDNKCIRNLDQQAAEHFAKTINKLKRKVTMIFISHQIPRGLQLDEVFSFGGDHQHTTKVEVVWEEKQ